MKQDNLGNKELVEPKTRERVISLSFSQLERKAAISLNHYTKHHASTTTSISVESPILILEADSLWLL